MHPSFAAVLAVAVLAGCTGFPQIDAAEAPAARRAPFPDLVPLEPLLDAGVRTDVPTGAGDLARRADRLRAAAAARRPALTPEERARLADAAASPADPAE